MRISIILLFILTVNPSKFIEGNDFSGYIFEENHFVLLSIENQNKRYTPTKEDIFLVEKIIKNKIKCANSDLMNQSNGCPKIHKKLKKYIRQYVGFINNDGQKVIWVNFIWKNNFSDDKVASDIIQVLDGCSYYWNAKINIDDNSVYDLSINGNG